MHADAFVQVYKLQAEVDCLCLRVCSGAGLFGGVATVDEDGLSSDPPTVADQ